MVVDVIDDHWHGWKNRRKVDRQGFMSFVWSNEEQFHLDRLSNRQQTQKLEMKQTKTQTN